jgi:hypothetical protein
MSSLSRSLCPASSAPPLSFALRAASSSLLPLQLQKHVMIYALPCISRKFEKEIYDWRGSK